MGFLRNFFNRRKERDVGETIRRMFFERANAFTKTTYEILKRMPGALDAIFDLIEERETFKDGGVLEWTEVTLVNAGNEEAAIILVGVILFPVGAEVTLETGEKVIVTEETAQYFQPRMVRVGVPLKLAESSKEEVCKYLKESEAELQKDLEETDIALKELLGAIKGEDVEPVNVVKKDDTISTSADFDLTQLTEEQRQQLILSTKMGRG